MDSKAKLYAALVEAQRQAKGVEKASTNPHHRYAYASADDVVQEARDALAAAGLAFFPTRYAIVYGTDTVEDALDAHYLLAHTSGETLEITSSTPIIPEKGRPADKAVAAAKTYDLSYALRGLLLLPRVDEAADVDRRDDRSHTPRRHQAEERREQQRSVWERLDAAATMFGGQERLLEAIGASRYPTTEHDAGVALSRAIEAHRIRSQQQPKEAARSLTPNVGSPSDDGPPGSAPPTEAPPRGLSVVPKEADTQHPGPNANQNRDEAQTAAPNGKASGNRGNGTAQGERTSTSGIGPDEFWSQIKKLDRRNLAAIRSDICKRYLVRDAGRISAEQRMDYLRFISGGAEGGAR